MKRQSILDRIVKQRTGQVWVGTVSVAVEKWAEELAKDAMEDPEIRRAWKELVKKESEAFLKRLLRNGKPAKAKKRALNHRRRGSRG